MEDIAGSEEEPVVPSSTPSIDIAKRLLNGKKKLPVEVAKGIYNSSLGDEYKGM